MIFDLRKLGVASMIVFIATAGLPLLGGPVDWQNSVSYTWSGTKPKFLLVGVIMSLAVTCICASFLFWLIPFYHLPTLPSIAIIAVAYVAAIGVLWVPMRDRPGEHSFRHPHYIGGVTLATLAALFLAIVVWFGVNMSSLTRIACFFAMVLAACWPLLFFTKAKRVFLALESLIALSSSVAIILLLIG